MNGAAGSAVVWRLAVAGHMTLLVGMGLGRFSYSPLIPALIESGRFSAGEAGYVGAFNLAGYLVGALLMPLVRRRFRAVPVLRACLILSCLALVASILPLGFAWLAWWRFLVGCTVALMMVLSLALVVENSPPRVVGRATGLTFTGVGIGIALSGTLVPWLLSYGLAWAWSGLALIGFVGMAIAWWGWNALPEEPPPAEQPAASRRAPPGLLTPQIGLLIVAYFFYAVGMVAHSIFWVDYVARGLGQGMAAGGFQWVLVGLGAVTGPVLCGWLADRIGMVAGLVLMYSALAIGIAMPVLLAVPATVIASSLIFGAQPGLSAIMSGRVGEVAPPRQVQRVWRWLVVATGVGQTLGGYVLVTIFAETGDYAWPFLISAAAMAGGAVCCLPWERLRRRTGKSGGLS